MPHPSPLAPHPFVWIALHRARAGGRWVWENGFTIFVMGPLIIGGAALIFQPSLEVAGRVLREGSDALVLQGWAAGGLFALLVFARFSGTVRDVYALDGADHYLDGLPVPPFTRLHIAILVRILKALPLAVAGIFVHVVARPRTLTVIEAISDAVPPLVGCAAALGLVEIACALVLIRLRVVGAARLAAAAVLAVPAVAALAGWLGWWTPLLAPAAYPVAALGFLRWRTEDRERAREALARARRTPVWFERLADRLVGPCAGAQVVRDLRLVRRGFSTTAYVAAAMAVLFPAVAVWASNRFDLEGDWPVYVVESATVLSAFSLAAITHALVHYERPRFWIDLTSGAEHSELPRAKRWTGRLLALPAVALGLAAVVAVGLPVDGWEVPKLAFLAWATATLTSVLCYEVADRPAAGLVLAFLPGVGIPLLFVFHPPLSGMWFAIYYYVSTKLFDLAGLRARRVLSAEC